MRLLTVRSRDADQEVAALLVNGRVLPLASLGRTGDAATELDGALARQDVLGLLRRDPDLQSTRRALAGVLDRRPEAVQRASLPLEAFRPAPPLPRPGKIVCIGLNYRDHIEEQHIPIPDRPKLFAKFGNAVVADGEPVIRHAATHALDLEVELAVVIGRRARRVTADEALRHVAGYTAANDVTARDLQGEKPALLPGEHGDGQWLRAKGSDSFLPMGPVIVTLDELVAGGFDPAGIRLRSWRIPALGPDAGREVAMQDGTSADLIVDVPHLIAFVSAVITLEPGDVIVTGTPAGVGVFRDPPVFCEPGDVMRVEAEGIGSLTNPVVDALGAAPEGSPAWRQLHARSRAGSPDSRVSVVPLPQEG